MYNFVAFVIVSRCICLLISILHKRKEPIIVLPVLYDKPTSEKRVWIKLPPWEMDLVYNYYSEELPGTQPPPPKKKITLFSFLHYISVSDPSFSVLFYIISILDFCFIFLL